MGAFIEDAVKLHLVDELIPATNRGFYVCPLCLSGTGKGKGKPDGALKVTADGRKWHCFSCNEGGDIVDLLEKRDGLDKAAARKTAIERYGNSPIRGNSKPKPQIKQNNEESQDKEEWENYISECALAIKGSKGEEYFKHRGFSDDTIDKYRLGYDAGKKAVVIPYPGTNYYTTRTITTGENEIRYRKIPNTVEPLFIAGNHKQPLFVCEGQIDALSLLQAGAGTVAAIGGGGDSKLEQLKGIKRAIIVRDNDEAGEKTAKRIEERLANMGVSNILTVNPPAGMGKDCNDILQSDENLLTGMIIEWIDKSNATETPDNVSDYLKQAFERDIENFKSFKDRKTGFSNIDAITSLYPGLYVVGAISSLGKTTFVHQVGDQLARMGNHVIYFSLEQNRMEMVSKGLSRITAQHDINNAVSAIDIRRGKITQSVKDAIMEYEEISKNLYVRECSFDTTIENITEYVKEYMEATKENPVVIVDYLQIIRPTDPRQSTKDAVDMHVRALKKLQTENNLVLFVISSLNRQNYLTPVDFESFKESGGIEYTADVIWGLQLQVMNSDLFNSEKKLKDKREAVRKAKLENPRKIELMCLKNRYGKSSYHCEFNYYPQYDYFLPESEFAPLLGDEIDEDEIPL